MEHGNEEDHDDGRTPCMLTMKPRRRIAMMHVREMEQPKMESTKVMMTSNFVNDDARNEIAYSIKNH